MHTSVPEGRAGRFDLSPPFEKAAPPSTGLYHLLLCGISNIPAQINRIRKDAHVVKVQVGPQLFEGN